MYCSDSHLPLFWLVSFSETTANWIWTKNLRYNRSVCSPLWLIAERKPSVEFIKSADWFCPIKTLISKFGQRVGLLHFLSIYNDDSWGFCLFPVTPVSVSLSMPWSCTIIMYLFKIMNNLNDKITYYNDILSWVTDGYLSSWLIGTHISCGCVDLNMCHSYVHFDLSDWPDVSRWQRGDQSRWYSITIRSAIFLGLRYYFIFFRDWGPFASFYLIVGLVTKWKRMRTKVEYYPIRLVPNFQCWKYAFSLSRTFFRGIRCPCLKFELYSFRKWKLVFCKEEVGNAEMLIIWLMF